jgi:hypothetical protein
VTYGELWAAAEDRLGRRLGSRYRQQPFLLEYIADRTFERKHALITALVVDEGNPRPGEGFFRLAVARDLLPPEDAPASGEPWTEMTARQRSFWYSQLATLGYPMRDEYS